MSTTLSSTSSSQRKKRTFDIAFLTGQSEQEENSEPQNHHDKITNISKQHSHSTDSSSSISSNSSSVSIDILSPFDTQLTSLNNINEVKISRNKSTFESSKQRKIEDKKSNNKNNSAYNYEDQSSSKGKNMNNNSYKNTNNNIVGKTSGNNQTIINNVHSERLFVSSPHAQIPDVTLTETELFKPHFSPPLNYHPHPHPSGFPNFFPKEQFGQSSTSFGQFMPLGKFRPTILPPSLSALSLPAQNVCAKCSIGFRMTSDLVYHMRSHHKREGDPCRKRREDKLKCPVCHETFRERHHLTRHMTAHQDRAEEAEEGKHLLA